jgi:hypothetical protein
MTKRSLIHPKLKTAVSSLDLEIEAEISRYQQQKSSKPPKNAFLGETTAIIPQESSQNSEVELWHYQVFTTTQNKPVAQLIDLFKRPLGIASVIITILGSGLLGMSLTQPVSIKSSEQIPESLAAPKIVDGVNLATEEVELNLQTLSTINSPKLKLVKETEDQPNTSRQPQSQLHNRLLREIEQKGQ